jgi:hypothetical protein
VILGEIQPPSDEAVPVLTAIAQDPQESADVRCAAVLALWQLKVPVQPQWKTILADGLKNGLTRYVAAHAISYVDPSEESSRALMSLLKEEPNNETFSSALAQTGAAAVPLLVDSLKDPKFRRTALHIIRDIGPAAANAVPVLASILLNREDRSLDYQVFREDAANALLAISAAAGSMVADLVPLINDSDLSVQNDIVLLMGRIGPSAKAALPRLVVALREGNILLKQSAVLSVAAVGPADTQSAIPALLAALRDPQTDAEAALALPELPSAVGDTAPALVGILRSTSASRQLKICAAAAIRALGVDTSKTYPDLDGLLRGATPEVSANLSTLYFHDRFIAAWTASQLTGIARPLVPALIAMLNDDPAYAAEALGRLGSDAKDAVPGLRELARPRRAWERANPEAQRAATLALRRINEGVDRNPWVLRPN